MDGKGVDNAFSSVHIRNSTKRKDKEGKFTFVSDYCFSDEISQATGRHLNLPILSASFLFRSLCREFSGPVLCQSRVLKNDDHFRRLFRCFLQNHLCLLRSFRLNFLFDSSLAVICKTEISNSMHTITVGGVYHKPDPKHLSDEPDSELLRTRTGRISTSFNELPIRLYEV